MDVIKGVAPAKPSTVSVNDDTLTVSGYAEAASVIQIFDGNALLTTDGYWNGNAGKDHIAYGPGQAGYTAHESDGTATITVQRDPTDGLASVTLTRHFGRARSAIVSRRSASS